MAASLPPTSRVTGRRNALDCLAMATPVAVEPVNETLSKPGWATIAWPTARPPPSTLNTPGGSTALAIRPTSRVLRGVSSEGLSTTVLPPIRAAATFCSPSTSGPFQGAMAATTPSGLQCSLTLRWSSSIRVRPGARTAPMMRRHWAL
jgi:hypothetical protein